jgi:hypothetical protein
VAFIVYDDSWCFEMLVVMHVPPVGLRLLGVEDVKALQRLTVYDGESARRDKLLVVDVAQEWKLWTAKHYGKFRSRYSEV